MKFKNQITNTKNSKKTTEIEQEIIKTDDKLGDRIISVLEDLNLIEIGMFSKNIGVQYSEDILEKFRYIINQEGFDDIIISRCK